MSYFEEARFCSAEEYLRNIAQKVEGQDLENDGLYLLMLLCRDGVEGKEAAQFPARVADVEYISTLGAHAINLSVLDNDHREQVYTPATIHGGIWVDANEHIIVINVGDGTKFQTESGYLRDRYDLMDAGIQELFTQLEVPTQPLIPAFQGQLT